MRKEETGRERREDESVVRSGGEDVTGVDAACFQSSASEDQRMER